MLGTIISVGVCIGVVKYFTGKAFSNVTDATRNYSDGWSIGAKAESEKYRQKQYDKYGIK